MSFFVSEASPKLRVLWMDAAHHTDLSLPSPADPASLSEARAAELQQLREWLASEAEL